MLTNYKLQEKYLFSVDCAIFGYHEEELKLLLFNRQIEPEKGKWSLVGGWVNPEESSDDAAKRVLSKITGLEDVFMEQVETFSAPKRDSGGRVISIVYYSLIQIGMYDKELIDSYGAKWVSVRQLPPLIFDHELMVSKSLEKMRQKASNEIVGEQLLPEKFTMLQLRNLYSAIFQKEFDPGNFRKKILSTKVLMRLDVKNTTESKKGAYYFKFRDDTKNYYVNSIIKIHDNR